METIHFVVEPELKLRTKLECLIDSVKLIQPLEAHDQITEILNNLNEIKVMCNEFHCVDIYEIHNKFYHAESSAKTYFKQNIKLEKELEQLKNNSYLKQFQHFIELMLPYLTFKDDLDLKHNFGIDILEILRINDYIKTIK